MSKSKKRKDSPAFEILLKVVQDTLQGFPLEIIQILYKNQQGLSKDEIAEKVNLSPSHTYTILTRDMQTTNLVQYKPVNNGTGQRGRNTHKYILTPEILNLCRKVFR